VATNQPHYRMEVSSSTLRYGKRVLTAEIVNNREEAMHRIKAWADFYRDSLFPGIRVQLWLVTADGTEAEIALEPCLDDCNDCPRC